MNHKLDLTLCMLHATSFRLKIFYLIQTSIHVGMSTLKKTTKMGQWYIFAATQQQTQTNICWDKTCVWVMEFKITTLPLLNWHHTHRQKNRQKIVPIISSALNACMHTKQLYVSRAVSYFNDPEFAYTENYVDNIRGGGACMLKWVFVDIS